MAFEDSRSLADVLKDIVGNLQQIVRAEIRLAQLEVREEVSTIARAGAIIAVGAVFCVLALGFLLWAAVYLLATVVALWLAVTIVAAAAGGLGGALIAGGMARMRRVAFTPKTVTTVRENIQWVKARSN